MRCCPKYPSYAMGWTWRAPSSHVQEVRGGAASGRPGAQVISSPVSMAALACPCWKLPIRRAGRLPRARLILTLLARAQANYFAFVAVWVRAGLAALGLRSLDVEIIRHTDLLRRAELAALPHMSVWSARR